MSMEDRKYIFKMNEIIDLMLAVRERSVVFYHKDTKQFDYCPISKIELKKLDFNRLISDKDLNNFRLPSYEEINHKDIMSFYVKKYVEDKEIKKQLFYTLRKHDYIDAYIDKLHELNLYDDFIDACGNAYIQIFEEWADKNGLDFE